MSAAANETTKPPEPPSPFSAKAPTSKPTTPLTSVERALKASLLPAEIRDVHLYAFSRRMLYADGAVRIDCPQAILAIGSILRETEHFSNLLTSGFSETNPDAPSPIRQYAYESEYDYESDSDLDEFEDPDPLPAPVASSTSAGGSSRAKGKGKDDGSATEEGEASAQSQGTDPSQAHRILIPNIAHRTLRACIFYLYTGKINFLPLKSEGTLRRNFALLFSGDLAPPPCSPKSMYRLAESYGMSELQDLAYNEIISRLNPSNIVEEAFSSFFARYDRLREHAVSYLSQQYSDRAIQDALPEVIERIVLGDMPHAGGVLRSLLGLRVAVSGPLPGLRPSAMGARPVVPPPPEPATPSQVPPIPPAGRLNSGATVLESQPFSSTNASTFSFSASPQPFQSGLVQTAGPSSDTFAQDIELFSPLHGPDLERNNDPVPTADVAEAASVFGRKIPKKNRKIGKR